MISYVILKFYQHIFMIFMSLPLKASFGFHTVREDTKQNRLSFFLNSLILS